MPTVVANSVAFNTHSMGAGTPVVMLHGLLVGNLASWFFTGARAIARSHRVHLYDLRGHGRSERVTTGYDIETMTDDLERLLDAWEIDEPVTLVGHSYGARISLQLAMRRPEAVGRMVVVEAPLYARTTGALTDFLDQDPDAMVDALPDALQSVVVRGGRRGSKLLDALKFLAYDTTMLADLRGQPDADFDALARLQHDTLLMYGTDSACLEAGRHLARVMPNSRLEVLEGGHYLPLEQPRAISKMMTAFIDGGADG